MKTNQGLHAESAGGGSHQHDNLVNAVMVRFFDNAQGDWDCSRFSSMVVAALQRAALSEQHCALLLLSNCSVAPIPTKLPRRNPSAKE